MISQSKNKQYKLSSGIWVLGFASFLTDISSEMIYPLLPVFLTQVLGASMAGLGLIEGIAEATAGLSKIYSGVLTDRLKRRKPLIISGYALSGAMRPLMGLATSWWMVLFFRFADRIGKGIRTAPRDALIADMVQPQHRGKAYGLHRAMDHAGSVVGPLIAGFLLTFLGLELRSVFFLAAVPAFLTLIVLWFGIKENSLNPQTEELLDTLPETDSNKAPTSLHNFTEESVASLPPFPSIKQLSARYQKLDPAYRKLLFCLFIFTLGDVSDVFLLMHLHSVGISASMVPILWTILHLVKMASSALGGRYADRFGYRRMIIAGWLFVSCIYGLFSWTTDLTITTILFVMYGIYFGFTEPSERALVANIAGDEERGMAFGLLHFTISMAVLPAGLIFGTLWESLGESVAFSISAMVTMSAAVFLAIALPKANQKEAFRKNM